MSRKLRADEKIFLIGLPSTQIDDVMVMEIIVPIAQF